MDRKCEISGVTFQVSPQELKLCRSYGVPLPRRTYIERLRYYLSRVPDLSACIQENSPFYLNAENNYLPSVNLGNLTPVPFSPSRLPELTGENCFSYLADLFNYWKAGKGEKPDSIPNYFCYNCDNSYDTCFSFDSEYLVNCIFINAGKRLYSARYSTNCSDSYFIENCEDCSFCLFSTNLKGKKYHVFNQEVPEAEFKDILDSLLLGDPLHLEAAQERFANFLKVQTFNASSFNSSESVSGRFINESSDVLEAYFSSKISESALIFGGYDIKSSVSLIASGGDIFDSYQSTLISGPAQGIRNSYLCGPDIFELDYCIGCKGSNNLMFCVGLENVQYCIFNQQLSEQEYFLFKDIVKKKFSQDIDWGCQLPSLISMIAYNESLASLFFPISKVQANLLGFEWNDALDIFKIDRDSSNIFICEISGVPFEINDIEIRLRTELGLSPPTRSPGQRFKDLISSTEFGPKKESICGLSAKPFTHYYRGSRLVIS